MEKMYVFKQDPAQAAPAQAKDVREKLLAAGKTEEEVLMLLQAFGLVAKPGRMRAKVSTTEWNTLVSQLRTHVAIGTCPPLKLDFKTEVGVQLIDTACWSFSARKPVADSRHLIYLGKDLFAWDLAAPKRFLADKGLTEAEVLLYLFAHLAHEAGHGRVTERDSLKTKAMLESVKCKVMRPKKKPGREEAAAVEAAQAQELGGGDEEEAQDEVGLKPADLATSTGLPLDMSGLVEVSGDAQEEPEMEEVIVACPFGLYNLMEDAWMEAWVREQMRHARLGNSVRKLTLLEPADLWKFNWLKLETPAWESVKQSKQSQEKKPKSKAVPTSGMVNSEAPPEEDAGDSLGGQAVLFSLIQAEGDVELIRKGWQDQVKAEKDQETLDWVVDYYHRLLDGMLAAQLEREVAGSPTEWEEGKNPMSGFLQEWVDRFPLKGDGKGQGGEPSDLAVGQALSTLSAQELKELAEAMKDMADKEGGDSHDEKLGASCHVIRDPSEKNEIASDGRPVLDKERTRPPMDIDMSRVKWMTGMVLKLFKQRPMGTWAEEPGAQGELDASRLMEFRTESTPWRVKLVRGARGIWDIVVVMDCSGSMGTETTLPNGQKTTHAREGVHFLAALNELAKNGSLSGHVIFSGVVEGKSAYQTFKFPVNMETLTMAHGMHGGEGLDHSMKSNEAILRAASTVFVYTDAQIGDMSVDKEGWARKGVEPIGLYVGSTETGYTRDCVEKLLKFFKRAIVRESMESVLEMLVAQKML